MATAAQAVLLLWTTTLAALVIASPAEHLTRMPYPAVAAVYGPRHTCVCNAVILAKGRLLTTADCLRIGEDFLHPEDFHVVMERSDIAPFENGAALVEPAAKKFFSKLSINRENKYDNEVSNDVFSDRLSEDEMNYLTKGAAMETEFGGSLMNDYISVRNFTIHPEMNGTFQNDVAILEVTDASPQSKDSIVEKVFLGDLSAYYNRSVQIYGWGLIKNTTGIQMFHTVRTVQMKLLPPSYCSSVLLGVFHPDQHLCLLPTTDETICVGFAGAPIVLDGKLIGIVSYGSAECGLHLPVVGVRLGNFADFLQLEGDQSWFTAVVTSLETAFHRTIRLFL